MSRVFVDTLFFRLQTVCLARFQFLLGERQTTVMLMHQTIAEHATYEEAGGLAWAEYRLATMTDEPATKEALMSKALAKAVQGQMQPLITLCHSSIGAAAALTVP